MLGYIDSGGCTSEKQAEATARLACPRGLLSRKDEPCGRSVPEAIMKVIRWLEAVAELPEADCYRRLAWAAKDKTVALSESAPLTKRSPRYPALLLVKMERFVLDKGEATVLRVFAWIKLLKIWACLRWSDLQAIKPADLRLTEGRLATTLRKTKTSGPTKRVKELPVCVSEVTFYEDPLWLETGFNLLKQLANCKRDYLLPRLWHCDGGHRGPASEVTDPWRGARLLDGAFREKRPADRPRSHRTSRQRRTC